MLVGSAAGSSGSIAVTGWTTFGNGPGRSSVASAAVRAGVGNTWAVRLPGHITSQPIVVRGAPGTHRATVYFATSAGVVAAFSGIGRELWRVQVGKLEHVCKQLPGYGVTGTPVADAVTRSLYFVDGVGMLHALDLRTGKERAGWPVRLYRADPARRLAAGRRARAPARRPAAGPQPGGPTVTEAGALLLAHADAVADRLAQADSQIAELAGAERATLRLGAFPSALASIVHGAIKRLHDERPELVFDVVEGSAHESGPPSPPATSTSPSASRTRPRRRTGHRGPSGTCSARSRCWPASRSTIRSRAGTRSASPSSRTRPGRRRRASS